MGWYIAGMNCGWRGEGLETISSITLLFFCSRVLRSHPQFKHGPWPCRMNENWETGGLRHYKSRIWFMSSSAGAMWQNDGLNCPVFTRSSDQPPILFHYSPRLPDTPHIRCPCYYLNIPSHIAPNHTQQIRVPAYIH